MSIVRISKNQRKRYTIVSNTPINCPNIDWPELGLLTYLMSKPDGWNVSIKHLTKQKPSGETRVKSLLKKLQDNGYAEWKRFHSGEVEWIIYEEPKVENPLKENDHIPPQDENPHVENPQEANPQEDFHPDIVKTQPLVKTDNKVNTEKESKEKKSLSKKIDLSDIDPPSNLNIPVWQKWMVYKSEIKKQYKTPSGIKTAMNDLAKLNHKQQESCINEAVRREWQGFRTDDHIGVTNGNNHNKKPETPFERNERLAKELKAQAAPMDLDNNVVEIPKQRLERQER